MTTAKSIEQEKNWLVAREINREMRANPDAAYTGKSVGVWHEQVAVVGATLDEVCDALDAMGEASDEACVIEVSADTEAKIMFWS